MMKIHRNPAILILIMTVLGVHGQKLSKTDLVSLYSKYNFTSLDGVVYHSSDEKSTVYLNIRLHHFEYIANETGKPEANYRVKYELYESYNSKMPMDAGTLFISDNKHAGEEMEMVVNFDVKASFPGTYVLKIEVLDLNLPEHSALKFMHIFKESRFSAQNFFLTNENEHPLFGNSIFQNNYFRIRYNNPDIQEPVIRYYSRKFPIAKPPFAMEKNVTYTFEPDSFYSIQMTGGISPLLELPYHGIYHIQADLLKPEGFTLYRFEDGFPDVSVPAQALAPLRYLTTEREFDKLLAYEDYKIAVDSFWLERASYNPDRAKKMIKKYYRRVMDVNLFFSSFQEGWKTDRGLIYIIYGTPSEVYRTDEEEEWIYGEKGNPMSMRFYFYKTDNPFTTNDYSLQRSPIYKTSWYIAIENWRR